MTQTARRGRTRRRSAHFGRRFPALTSAIRDASRRARASACITSKPVGDTTTTGTCARVFRKPPFEPAATITSGRAVPASAIALSASS